MKLPFGPLCFYTAPFLPERVLGPAVWRKLVSSTAAVLTHTHTHAHTHAHGDSHGARPEPTSEDMQLAQDMLTRQFIEVCDPHDVSLGSVRLTDVFRADTHTHTRTLTHAHTRKSRRAQPRALSGAFAHILSVRLIKACAPSVLSPSPGTSPGGIQAVLARVRLPFEVLTHTLAHTATLRFDALAREALALQGITRDLGLEHVRSVVNWLHKCCWCPGQCVCGGVRMCDLVRVITRELHSDGQTHDVEAWTQLVTRYPVLLLPMISAQNHVRAKWFDAVPWRHALAPARMCVCAPACTCDGIGVADATSTRDPTAPCACGGVDVHFRDIAMVCTARVLMLEAVSHAAVPFAFGGEDTATGLRDKGMVAGSSAANADKQELDSRDAAAVGPGAWRLKLKRAQSSARLQDLRSMTGESKLVPPKGDEVVLALTTAPLTRAQRRRSIDEMRVHDWSAAMQQVPGRRASVVLEALPDDASAEHADGEHDATSNALVVVPQSTAALAIHADAAQWQSTIAFSLVRGIFSASANHLVADRLSDTTRGLMFPGAFSGSLTARRLAERKALEDSLPRLMPQKLRSNVPPRCTDYTMKHDVPGGDSSHLNMTSAQAAARVLTQALAEPMSGLRYGRVRGQCLLCTRPTLPDDVASVPTSPTTMNTDATIMPAQDGQHDSHAPLAASTSVTTSPGPETQIEKKAAPPGVPKMLSRRTLAVTKPVVAAPDAPETMAQVTLRISNSRMQDVRMQEAQLQQRAQEAKALADVLQRQHDALLTGHVVAPALPGLPVLEASDTSEHAKEARVVRFLVDRDRDAIVQSVLDEVDREVARRAELSRASAMTYSAPNLTGNAGTMKPMATALDARRRASILAVKEDFAARNKKQRRASIAERRRSVQAMIEAQRAAAEAVQAVEAKKPRATTMPAIAGNCGFCDECREYAWYALAESVGFNKAATIFRSAFTPAPAAATIRAASAAAAVEGQPLIPARVAENGKLVRVDAAPPTDTFMQAWDAERARWFYHNLQTGDSTWARPDVAAIVNATEKDT